ASQASTSANSAARSWGPPPRRAPASSPTSSMNHMKVPSAPRRSSLAPYVSRICLCNCASVKTSTLPFEDSPQALDLVVLLLRLQRLEQRLPGLLALDVDLQRLPGVALGLGVLLCLQQQLGQALAPLQVVGVGGY